MNSVTRSPSKISSYFTKKAATATASALAAAVELETSPPKKKFKGVSTLTMSPSKKNENRVKSDRDEAIQKHSSTNGKCDYDPKIPDFLFVVADVTSIEGSIVLALKRVETENTRESTCTLADSW